MAKAKRKLNLQMNRKNLLIFAVAVVVIVGVYFALFGGNTGQGVVPILWWPPEIVRGDIPDVVALKCVSNADCTQDKKVCNPETGKCVTCYETDGGDDKYTGGKVVYYWSSQGGAVEKYDECSSPTDPNGKIIAEYWCNAEGSSKTYDWDLYTCSPDVCGTYSYGDKCEKKSGGGNGDECNKNNPGDPKCTAQGKVCNENGVCVDCYDTDGKSTIYIQGKTPGTVYVGKNTGQVPAGRDYLAIDDKCDTYSGGLTGACPPSDNPEPGQCSEERCSGTCKKLREGYCDYGKWQTEELVCTDEYGGKLVCRCDKSVSDKDEDGCSPSACMPPYS
ncbi:MAG: hypothetical protein ABH854_02670 [Candidatus Diapherotrites archaeon]